MSGFAGNKRRYAYQEGTLYIQINTNNSTYSLMRAQGNSAADHVLIERFATLELAADAQEKLKFKRLKEKANGKREVFPTDEIPHLWAHKVTYKARNAGKTLFFEDDTIYSYGSHFPIAMHVNGANGKRKAILINSGSASVTTSNHQNMVARAIPSETIRFYVPNVNTYSHSSNLAAYLKQANRSWEKANRSVKYGANHLSDMFGALNSAKAYARFFGLDVSDLKLTVSKKQIVALEAKFAASELKRKQREQWERDNPSEAQRIRQEAFAKRNAAAIAKFEREKQEWFSGERSQFPINPAAPRYGERPNAELRIKDDEVQTSQGARIPVTHAIRGLRLVRAVMRSGKEYKRNGHTEHLGPYAVDSISTDGTLRAGCHVITWESINRIAPALDRLQEIYAVANSGKDTANEN